MGHISHEPSMEEILSSIKRIIAEDDAPPARAKKASAKATKLVQPSPEPEILAEPEDSEPDAAQILALGQEAALLRSALGALAPDQARVLEQAYFEELPHSRISELTGIPLGTIKSRIRLGLERLRRDLNDLRQP